MTHTIFDVPIFKVGLHNNKDYLHADLQEMVDNFNALKVENPDFEIPVKVGHPDNLDSEKPAISWMKNLRVEGDFIIADFFDLSDEAYDMLKSKQYKNRSVEIMNNFVNSLGVNLGKVISGIAVLGSSLPALNLPDIKFKSKMPAYALQFAKDNAALIEKIETENYERDIFAEAPKTMVQTIICMKDRFKTEAAAAAWIKSNKFMDDGVDETDNSYRFRQKDPSSFEDNSFRTISLTDGVSAVIGKPKEMPKEKPAKNAEQIEPENFSSKKIINKQKEEHPMDAKSTIVLDKQPEKAAPTEVLKKGDEAQSFDAEKIKLLESFSSADDIVKQLKEFASAKAEIEKLKKAQETMKRESFKKEVDSFAANLVEEKKLLPKHRELVKGIMFALDESKTVEFEKEFGKKEKESLIEVFKYFLSSLPEHGLLTTFAQNSALTDRQEALEAFWKLKGLTPDDVKKMDENRFKSFLIEFERKRAEFADAAKH